MTSLSSPPSAYRLTPSQRRPARALTRSLAAEPALIFQNRCEICNFLREIARGLKLQNFGADFYSKISAGVFSGAQFRKLVGSSNLAGAIAQSQRMDLFAIAAG